MQRENRRLAAIVAADVAGYSRLIGQDEEGTLRALRAHRQELIDRLIDEHGGRIANTAGDSLLLEFPSVVDAVRCAMAVQRGMTDRNCGIDQDQQILFRIGIHVGDVIAEGGDLLGDGVNVAARLEALASPGGIILSDDAYRQVRDRLDVAWDDGGEHAVKNIVRPIQVWRWSSVDEGRMETALIPTQLPLPDKPSIAVLPFANMSGDPEQEYFADGITEDIITDLSQYRSIFVIARNSAFSYKGRNVKVQDVGRDLGVHYVVEGSIRKTPKRLRVTAQLVEAATGNHVWAQRYDRDLDDLFAVQDELTQAIAAAVPARLEAADLERAKRKPPDNLTAYDYLIRAKDHHHKFTKEDNANALELLQKAVALDPQYGHAYAWLSCTYGQAWIRGYLENSEFAWKETVAAAQKAYAIDENDSECRRILAAIYLNHRDYDQAKFHHERAISLNPNDPLIVSQRGYMLVMLGEPDEGIQWIERAMRLDPYRPDLFGNNLGIALHAAKRYEQAIAALQKIATLRDRHHAYMAACYVELGNREAAQVQVAEVLKINPNFSSENLSETMPYKNDADRIHLREGLHKAGLPE